MASQLGSMMGGIVSPVGINSNAGFLPYAPAGGMDLNSIVGGMPNPATGGNMSYGGDPIWSSIIGNILSGGYSLYQGLGGGEGTVRGDTAAAAAAADPFASQRPQYQQMLSKLLTTPGSFQADPGYQFAVEQGTEAASRAANSLYGTTRVGALAPEIAKYVTGYANQAYNTRIEELLKASGALTGSPAAAGEIMGWGALQRNNAIGTGLGNFGPAIGSLLPAIGKLFGGGGGGINFGSYGTGPGAAQTEGPGGNPFPEGGGGFGWGNTDEWSPDDLGGWLTGGGLPGSFNPDEIDWSQVFNMGG